MNFNAGKGVLTDYHTEASDSLDLSQRLIVAPHQPNVGPNPIPLKHLLIAIPNDWRVDAAFDRGFLCALLLVQVR